MYNELCIDLGSSSVIISTPERGIIERQSCVTLIDRYSGKVVAYGDEAVKKHAESPADYILDRPLRDGIAKNIDRVQALISMFLSSVCGNEFVPDRVLFSVPCDIEPMEESALVEVAAQCGIRDAYVMYSPLAALLASEMDVVNSYISVDVGASKTNIMIICHGNIVYSESVDCGGNKFDSAIAEYVFDKHGVRISAFTAENIKKKIGTLWGDDSSNRTVDVKTRRPDGSFSTIRISSEEMFVALEEPTAVLIEAVCTAISNIPTQYVNDVFSHGILLCGGGALLGGLSKIIAGITGVDAYVFPNSSDAVALGMSEALKVLPKKITQSIKNISRFCLKSLGGYNI
ncbi:MAG: rod shape-determining protein [Clostridia bacterium]|nr:rod shape-determining protein [Clostridia bacterium]